MAQLNLMGAQNANAQVPLDSQGASNTAEQTLAGQSAVPDQGQIDSQIAGQV
jgi:hypothetical protein